MSESRGRYDGSAWEDTMVAHLEWDRDQRAEVRSIQELDRNLDRLTEQARDKRPFSVDLILDNGSALAMVVGDAVSMMNFFSPTSRPPVVGCHGSWSGDAEELVVFDFRGEYSEIEKRYTAPIADAREGMRRFFSTGARPDNITWGHNNIGARCVRLAQQT